MKTDGYHSGDKVLVSNSTSLIMAGLIVGASIAAFILVASLVFPETASASSGLSSAS